jgi:hypothetical protein
MQQTTNNNCQVLGSHITACSVAAVAINHNLVPLQVILYICIFVWLINYHHFLSWKSLPNSWLPDPSTIQFSLAKATFYFKASSCSCTRWIYIF